MLKRMRNNLLLTFILTLLFGIILVFETNEFLMTINYVIVSILLIIGVIEIISYIYSKAYKENEYYGLIMGIICIWLAILFYLYYTTIILFLPIVLSLYAFIIGVITLIKFIERKTKLYLITSILSFVLGIALMFMPWFTIDVYFKIAGIYIIYTSVIYILEIRKIKKRKDH